jgi:glycosyltransferase involved in cell wall biosynthesis
MPFWEDNPYHSLLSDLLNEHDVEVRAATDTVFAPTMLARSEDVLHLHTLHQSFLASTKGKTIARLVVFLVQVALLRLCGCRIVWTVHDLSNHENLYPRIDRVANETVARLAHRLIVHCDAARDIVHTQLNAPRSKIDVVEHPSFVGVYPDTISKQEARRKLGVDQDRRLYLFLGLIRPYKGVPRLIRAFGDADVPSSTLLVAGSVYDRWEAADTLEATIRTAAEANPNVRFDPGFIPDDELQTYLRAADVFVVPYREALTSGALVLGMSFGLACIAPRVGCMKAMMQSGGVTFDPNSTDDLRAALEEVADLDTEAVGRSNQERISQHTWRKMAQETHLIYRQLTA